VSKPHAGDEQLARLVHEVNRAWQGEHGDDAPSLPWACESDHIRHTTLAGVRRARTGITPEQHHDAWCEAKRAAGWVWGPVKDPDAKTHPCLLPYGQLPEHQQAKDRVFLAIVRELTACPATREDPGQ
jgi:RyR domain-containing protein